MDVGDALVGLRVDAPVEAHGDFARTDAAVELDRVPVEFKPALGRLGNLDVEIDVGLDFHLEVARAVDCIVVDRNLRFVDRDGIVEALLVDGDFLVVAGLLVLDADYAAAGRGQQRRVDDQLAVDRAAAVGRRNGNPGFVGRGDPVVACSHPDGVFASFGTHLDGVFVHPEADGLVVGAAEARESAEKDGYIACDFHCLFSLSVIRAFCHSSGCSASCRR